jgi:hypothetical protein
VRSGIFLCLMISRKELRDRSLFMEGGGEGKNKGGPYV